MGANVSHRANVQTDGPMFLINFKDVNSRKINMYKPKTICLWKCNFAVNPHGRRLVGQS